MPQALCVCVYFADEVDYSVTPHPVPMNYNLNEMGPVQLKLLCGADLLESFAVPGLWKDEDVSIADFR